MKTNNFLTYGIEAIINVHLKVVVLLKQMISTNNLIIIIIIIRFLIIFERKKEGKTVKVLFQLKKK